MRRRCHRFNEIDFDICSVIYILTFINWSKRKFYSERPNNSFNIYPGEEYQDCVSVKKCAWHLCCPTIVLCPRSLWTQNFFISVALRSGITVASEVHPRRGYCWLKTFPNTPQDGLKYSRLCNFWRSIRGPYNNIRSKFSEAFHRRRCWNVREDGDLVKNRFNGQVDLRFYETSCNAISANMADEEEESSLELVLQRHKKEAKELQGILNSWYLTFQCWWCIILIEFLPFRSLDCVAFCFVAPGPDTWSWSCM